MARQTRVKHWALRPIYGRRGFRPALHAVAGRTHPSSHRACDRNRVSPLAGHSLTRPVECLRAARVSFRKQTWVSSRKHRSHVLLLCVAVELAPTLPGLRGYVNDNLKKLDIN